MLAFLLPVYFVLFVAMTAGGLHETIRYGLPRYVLVAEVVVSALATAGLVAFYFELKSDLLLAAWKPVSVAIVAGYAWFFYIDLCLVLDELDGDAPDGDQAAVIALGALIGLLVILPAVAINLQIGFGW